MHCFAVIFHIGLTNMLHFFHLKRIFTLCAVGSVLLLMRSGEASPSEDLFHVSSSKEYGGMDSYIELVSVRRDGDIVSMSEIDDFKKRRHIGAPHRSTRIDGSVNCKGVLIERHAYETFDGQLARGAKLESYSFAEPKKW